MRLAKLIELWECRTPLCLLSYIAGNHVWSGGCLASSSSSRPWIHSPDAVRATPRELSCRHGPDRGRVASVLAIAYSHRDHWDVERMFKRSERSRLVILKVTEDTGGIALIIKGELDH